MLAPIANGGPGHVPLLDRSNRWSFHQAADTLQHVVNRRLYLYPRFQIGLCTYLKQFPNWSLPPTIQSSSGENETKSETDFPTNLIPASLSWFVGSFSGQWKVVNHKFVFKKMDWIGLQRNHRNWDDLIGPKRSNAYLDGLETNWSIWLDSLNPPSDGDKAKQLGWR